MQFKPLLHFLGLGAALWSPLTGIHAQTTLISTNMVWRYLDHGSDQGTAWRGTAFSDSGWASGLPLFGTESPGIYPWPIRSPMPVGGGRITYYFRTHFTVGSPPLTKLTASGHFDDGAVFYVNGVEAGRVRVAADPVVFTSLASSASAEGVLEVVNLSAASLVAGTNLLAVELHQVSAESSDVLFGLTLEGDGAAPPPIKLFINEWLVDNVNGIVDPADGQHDCWFEIYNSGTNPVSLDGLYLTDILTDPFKFPIPPGYVVPSGGNLLVWADSQPLQNSALSPDLHVNFFLRTNGVDGVFLHAADGTVVDAVSFGPQTPDVSEGRFPDGATNRYFMVPTPRAANVLGPLLTCASNKVVMCDLAAAATNPPLYTVLRVFATNGVDGRKSRGGAIEGRDGALYGTTYEGGTGGFGTVFKLNQDGTGYTVLRNFGTAGTSGRTPYAGVIEGHDGALYGTTTTGGDGGAGLGTVFKLSKDGSNYTVLHTFTTNANDGRTPFAGLIQGRDGALYGNTSQGGSAGRGTVFKLGTDGSGYTVLRNFTTNSADGDEPWGALLEGRDGTIYGTTRIGGGSGSGTVFKLNKDGSGYTVLRRFTGTGGDGAQPYGALIEGVDGALYGTTRLGGTSSRGTVFKLNKDGSGYLVLRRFSPTDGDGGQPYAGVVNGQDGLLYGTCYDGGSGDSGTIFRMSTDGTGYTVLRSFSPPGGDARRPFAGLAVSSADGRFYGTTEAGGADGAGAVFRLELPCSLTFDPPTVATACCGGDNATLTVLSTVTNGVCPQFITRTWQATDCCSNSATCSQTVTLVSGATPVAFVLQPEDATAAECSSATFAVGVFGNEAYTFAWSANGVPIPGANGISYTRSPATMLDHGTTFTVTVTSECGSVTSAPAVLTVVADAGPPALVSAEARCDSTELTVTFSEGVDELTATNAANYQLSAGLVVHGAELAPDGQTVMLATDPIPARAAYTLTVSGVRDRCGNAIALTARLTLECSPPPPVAVSVNEWLVLNVNDILDPTDGQHDDWFELYNPGPEAADLSGYFLTDDPNEKFKFRIPAGYVIPAGGFLLVWADEDPAANGPGSPDLHVNFTLNEAGGSIGLWAPDGTAVDAITFFVQTADVSEGRWPDGETNRYFNLPTTPRGPNTPPLDVCAPCSSKGTNFWLTFPQNFATSEKLLTLGIAGCVGTTGRVTIPGLGFSTNYTIPSSTSFPLPFSKQAGGTVTVSLPAAAEVVGSDVTVNKGIHVTANSPVSVHGLNRDDRSTDGYLGLPENTLGTNYIVLSLGGTTQDGRSELAIVACQDNTTVHLTSPLTSFSVTRQLKAGDVYQLQLPAPFDLTGTKVAATKPVAVFAGSICAQVPKGVGGCDHLVEQLPPTSAWGKKFFTVPLATRTKGDLIRVLGSVNGTTLKVNGTTVATLNSGQVVEMFIPVAIRINANHPVLVAQYAAGHEWDNPGDDKADPFMMLVPATRQFVQEYCFTAPPAFYGSYLNLVVPNAAVNSVYLDGKKVPPKWFSSVGGAGSGFKVIGGPILPGYHRMTASLPFGVNIYGWAHAESLGYPADLCLPGGGCPDPTPSWTSPPGASYSTDFDPGLPADLSRHGVAIGQSQALKLIRSLNVNNQYGVVTFSVPTLIHAFRATFKLYIGGGANGNAEEFSFNLANDLPSSFSSGLAYQQGIGKGFSVVFDTSGNEGVFLRDEGLPAPGGTSFPIGGSDSLSQGPTVTAPGWKEVEITLDSCGNVKVTYDDVIYAIGKINYVPGPNARFALAARSIGQRRDNVWVDDLLVTTEAGESDITVNAPPNQCCAVVDFKVPVFVDEFDDEFTAVCVPPPGSCFPVGINRVCCTVANGTEILGRCGFHVTVNDVTPPMFHCQLPTLRSNACVSLVPDYRSYVTATDNCPLPNPLSVVQVPPPGTAVMVGPTTVTLTVCDASGNCASCTTIFTVLAPSKPIPGMYNTGVNNNRMLLPVGTPDPHYSGTDPNSVSFNPLAINPASFNGVPNTTNCGWIGTSTPQSSVGTHVYRLNFYLPPGCTNGVVMAGQWAAISSPTSPATMWLNGAPTGFSSSSASAFSFFVLTSGFVPGVNTIEFQVPSLPGQTVNALRVCFEGAFFPCCECGIEAPSGLVLWLPFDEPNTGGVAHNVVGGNNGKYVGPPTVNSSYGYVDNSLCFNGVNQKVRVPFYSAIDIGTNDFSIDAWVKHDLNDGGIRQIVNHFRPAGGPGYALYLSNGVLTLDMQAAGGSLLTSAGPTVPPDGAWHFVAATVQRGAPFGGRLWVDKVSSPPFNTIPANGSLANLSSVTIGARNSVFGPSESFKGCIDEVEIFNRQLSQPEITAIGGSQQEGKCKFSCTLPNAGFCPDDSFVIVQAMICNKSAIGQFFTFGLAGLMPGYGTLPPASLAFSTVPASPVFIPAGQCVPVNVTVPRPPGLTWPLWGCIELLVQANTSGEMTRCQAKVYAKDWWKCLVHVAGSSKVVLTETNTPNRGVFGFGPISLANPFDTNVVLNYRLRVEGPHLKDDTRVISLNGLPPGTVITNSVALTPGENFNIDISGQFLGDDPEQTYTIWIEGSVDGSLNHAPIADLAVNEFFQATLELIYQQGGDTRGLAVVWSGFGTLQCAPALDGPWRDVPDAANPYVIPSAHAARFYRLRQ